MDLGNADRRLVSSYNKEHGKYVDALEADRKDGATIRKIRCDAPRELIEAEAKEGPDRTEAKARALDVLSDALFGYGDVLLKGGRAPQLVINNEEGTEVSITEEAARILKEAGIPEWE